MFHIAYNVAKFIAVFLIGSVTITFIAMFLPQYRGELEYVGWGLIAVLEIWAFTHGRKFQFSLRAMLVVMTISALALGITSWTAKK